MREAHDSVSLVTEKDVINVCLEQYIVFFVTGALTFSLIFVCLGLKNIKHIVLSISCVMFVLWCVSLNLTRTPHYSFPWFSSITSSICFWGNTWYVFREYSQLVVNNDSLKYVILTAAMFPPAVLYFTLFLPAFKTVTDDQTLFEFFRADEIVSTVAIVFVFVHTYALTLNILASPPAFASQTAYPTGKGGKRPVMKTIPIKLLFVSSITNAVALTIPAVAWVIFHGYISHYGAFSVPFSTTNVLTGFQEREDEIQTTCGFSIACGLVVGGLLMVITTPNRDRITRTLAYRIVSLVALFSFILGWYMDSLFATIDTHVISLYILAFCLGCIGYYDLTAAMYSSLIYYASDGYELIHASMTYSLASVLLLLIRYFAINESKSVILLILMSLSAAALVCEIIGYFLHPYTEKWCCCNYAGKA